MDGATQHLDTTARLIALDIDDAAYRLWEELHDELVRSGDEYGNGPSLERAWDTYVDRGAHNYAWWDAEDAFNADGWTAFLRFTDAFEQAPELSGFLNAR